MPAPLKGFHGSQPASRPVQFQHFLFVAPLSRFINVVCDSNVSGKGPERPFSKAAVRGRMAQGRGGSSINRFFILLSLFAIPQMANVQLLSSPAAGVSGLALQVLGAGTAVPSGLGTVLVQGNGADMASQPLQQAHFIRFAGEGDSVSSALQQGNSSAGNSSGNQSAPQFQPQDNQTNSVSQPSGEQGRAAAQNNSSQPNQATLDEYGESQNQASLNESQNQSPASGQGGANESQNISNLTGGENESQNVSLNISSNETGSESNLTNASGGNESNASGGQANQSQNLSNPAQNASGEQPFPNLTQATVPATINVSYFSGLNDDFSNLVVQLVSGGRTSSVPFTMLSFQPRLWALISMLVPSTPYSIGFSFSSPQSAQPAPYTINVTYFSGLEPDFSNLRVQLVLMNGTRIDTGYELVSAQPSEWALISLSNAPQQGESVSLLAVAKSQNFTLLSRGASASLIAFGPGRQLEVSNDLLSRLERNQTVRVIVRSKNGAAARQLAALRATLAEQAMNASQAAESGAAGEGQAAGEPSGASQEAASNSSGEVQTKAASPLEILRASFLLVADGAGRFLAGMLGAQAGPGGQQPGAAMLQGQPSGAGAGGAKLETGAGGADPRLMAASPAAGTNLTVIKLAGAGTEPVADAGGAGSKPVEGALQFGTKAGSSANHGLLAAGMPAGKPEGSVILLDAPSDSGAQDTGDAGQYNQTNSVSQPSGAQDQAAAQNNSSQQNQATLNESGESQNQTSLNESQNQSSTSGQGQANESQNISGLTGGENESQNLSLNISSNETGQESNLTNASSGNEPNATGEQANLPQNITYNPENATEPVQANYNYTVLPPQEQAAPQLEVISSIPSQNLEVLDISQDDLSDLSSLGAQQIYVDTVMTASSADPVAITRADLVHSPLNYTGKGVAVCLLDTGVNFADPSLGGKAISGYNFVDNNDNASDDNGHGTFMASMIHAMAPDATIVSVRVLGTNGQGWSSDIISGIDYCEQLASGGKLKVISMSFGGGSYSERCDADPVSQAADTAIAAGLFPLASTGNGGGGSITAPACASNVTAVASSTADDAVSSFSNMNGMVSLLAPGEGVSGEGLSGPETRSGTSVSTAVAAGASALLLQSNSSLLPSGIGYRFKSTGIPIPFNLSGTPANFSRLDAYNAVLGNITNSPENFSVNSTNLTANYTYNVSGNINACGTLNAAGVYNLTQNVYQYPGDCFDVTAQNVTLDCKGYSIIGGGDASASGVYSLNQFNTTVQNCIISTFYLGVFFNNINNGIIQNVNASSIGGGGIYFLGNNITVSNSNGADSSGPGIRLNSGSNNSIINSTGTSSSNTGINLDATYSYLINSTGISTSNWGIYVEDTANHITISNSTGVSSSAPAIFVFGASSITIINSTGNTSTGIGIYLYGSSSNNSIINSTGTATGSTGYGIELNGSINTTISGSTATAIGKYGLYLYANSNNNTIANSTASSNTYRAIDLENSSNNTITNCTATTNTSYGIYLESSSANNTIANSSATATSGTGIGISSSSGNIISNSTSASNSSYGIYITSGTSNTIANSTLSSNTSYSTYIISSSNANTFYNNTFVSGNKTGTLLNIDGTSNSNTFYWNNFTNTSGYYASDSAGTNYYYASVGGHNEGNLWYNVLNSSVNITGTNLSSGFPAYYIGSRGSDYPYNTAHSQGKLSGTISDSAPLIPSACQVLDTPNLVYNLTSNVSISNAICFTVTAQNVTLDCKGYSIIGDNGANSGDGVYSNQYNTTVKNCRISGFTYGTFYSYGTDNSLVQNVNASVTSASGWTGIFFEGSNSTVSNSVGTSINGYGIRLNSGVNNSIINSTGNGTYTGMGIVIESASGSMSNSIGISNLSIGIASEYTYNFTITNSTGITNGAGDYGAIELFGCKNITVINSTAISTSALNGFYVDGSSNSTFINLTAASNSSYGIRLNAGSTGNNFTGVSASSNVSDGIHIEGASPSNSIDCKGGSITGGTNTAGTSGVYSNQYNTTVKNCNISNFQYGVQFYGIQNSTISGTNATSTQGGGYGFYLTAGAGYDTISGSRANSTASHGIALLSSPNNTIANSTSASGSGDGIYLSSSSNNNITNFVGISNTGIGIDIEPTSNFNTITNSTGTATGSGGYGIALFEGNNNTISGSTATAIGRYGLYLYLSYNNTIANSTASSNTYRAIDLEGSSNNTITNCTATTNTSFGIYLESNSNGNRISNSNATSTNGTGLAISSSSSNTIANSTLSSNINRTVYINSSSNASTFYNNTFVSGNRTGTLLTLDGTPNSNTFYWNNFTNTSGLYVNDTNGSNYFNSSTEGNIWYDVQNGSVQIYGTTASSGFPSLYIGTSGTGYPYNNSTSSKISGNVTDYHPLTPINTLCKNLSSSYTLTGNANITGATCFNVTAANVTLDCAGYSITGTNTSSTYGVYSTQFNTTVKNCNISNFQHGVYFQGATNGTIQNTNASTTSTLGYAIYLDSSSNYNTITNSTGISGYYIGIYLHSSSNYNTITGSTGASTSPTAPFGYGICLDSSSNNNITNSTGTSNASSSGVGIYISSSSNNIIISSTGTTNSSPSNGAGIYISSSSNNNITNSTGTSAGKGIELTGSSNSIINNSVASNLVSGASGYGLYITSASDNTQVISTTASSINSSAFYINGGSNVSVDCKGKSITGTNTSSTYGIYSSQFNTTIKNCNINWFDEGIEFSGATNGTIDRTNATTGSAYHDGMHLSGSSFITVSNSYAATASSGGFYGIYIWNSNNNTIVNTTGVAASGAGLTAHGSSSGNLFTNATGISTTGYGISIQMNALDNQVTNSSGQSNSSYGIINRDSANRTIFLGTVGFSNSSSGIYVNGGSNVSIDCQGMSINGTNTSSTYGIYSNQFNTTVKNCIVSNFSTGIYIGGSNGTISNSNATTTQSPSGNYGYGLLVFGNYANITNSAGTANSNGYGIYLYGVTSGTIYGSSGTSTSSHAIYFSGSAGGNAIINSTGSSGSDYGIDLSVSSNNTISNSTFRSNSSYAALMNTNATNNTFINNTFASGGGAGTLLYLNTLAGGNTFYWNNFTSTSGYYVQDLNGSNYYNTTNGTTAMGNIWYNVINGSVNIIGNAASPFPSLYYGSRGAGYPYNNSSALGKLSGNVTDWGPLTLSTNTCTPPSYPLWAINCSDSCAFTSNVTVAGNVSLSSTGNVTLYGRWNFTSTGQTVSIGSGCNLAIYSGGGWNR